MQNINKKSNVVSNICVNHMLKISSPLFSGDSTNTLQLYYKITLYYYPNNFFQFNRKFDKFDKTLSHLIELFSVSRLNYKTG